MVKIATSPIRKSLAVMVRQQSKTGASGQMGTVVIETLLKKMPAQQIHVITHKDEKRLASQPKVRTTCRTNKVLRSLHFIPNSIFYDKSIYNSTYNS